MNSGYVYVMSNISLCGLVKIGVSFNCPHEIALNNSKEELIPDKFIVEYYSKFHNLYEAEIIVRNQMQMFHYKKDFYKVDKKQAIDIIQNVDLKKDEVFVKESKKNIINIENEIIII